MPTLTPAPGGFDCIIIGAGAAGCVLANRLSADPACIFLLPHARTHWQHIFSGGPGVMNRSIPCPRGKLFGGSTSVNGTVYIRGHTAGLRRLGGPGQPGPGLCRCAALLQAP